MGCRPARYASKVGMVASGLLDAVGILHPGPRLVVLPDDRRLGVHRAEFAGLLGTIQVHANERKDESPDFAGAAEVDGSDDVFPQAVPFADTYPKNLLGLTNNSTPVDRSFLTGAAWEMWNSVVAQIQRDLTDAKIEAAVRRMPPEYFAPSGPELIRTLRARRDRLGGASCNLKLGLPF